jgi:hypothetical protein
MSQEAVNKLQPSKPNIQPVKKIWIHMNPDIDEIIAVQIAMDKGKFRFPGVDSAEINYVDPSQVTESYDALIAKGILCIGFGDGPFNEHGDENDGERLEGHSCASLVASVLGCRYSTGYRELVDYTIKKDSSVTDSHMFEIATLAKHAFRYIPGREKDAGDSEIKMNEILNAVFILLEGFILQRNAAGDCAKEFAETANKCQVTKPNGKNLRIVSVVSANPEMQKYCRSAEGGGAGIIIQRQESGNTQIFFNYQQVDEDTVEAIIVALRRAERHVSGYRRSFNIEELKADGVVPGAKAWYYERSKRLILNGSLTQSRPPTKLERADVEAIVYNAVENHFGKIAQQREERQKAQQPVQPKPELTVTTPPSQTSTNTEA